MTTIYTINELMFMGDEVHEITIGRFSVESERDKAFNKFFYFIGEDIDIRNFNPTAGRWARKGMLKVN